MPRKKENVLFVDWCPKDALIGMLLLSPLAELACRRINDAIYVYNDRLPDDDKKLAELTRTGKKWPKIKAELIEDGSIEIIDGRITNDRCQEVLEKVRNRIAQARGAGIASGKSRKRKQLKEKKTGGTGVGASVVTERATTQEPNKLQTNGFKNSDNGGKKEIFLLQATMDRAKKIADGWNVYEIEAAFLKWVEKNNIDVRNPDAMFLDFVKTHISENHL